MPATQAPKRRYTIDKQTARERARKAAAARYSPDTYISSLERATLTAAQLQRLVRLLLRQLDQGDGAA